LLPQKLKWLTTPKVRSLFTPRGLLTRQTGYWSTCGAILRITERRAVDIIYTIQIMIPGLSRITSRFWRTAGESAFSKKSSAGTDTKLTRLPLVVCSPMVLNWLLPNLLEILFPTRCVVCKRRGALLCQECVAKLPALDKEFCIVCDKPAVGGFTHPGCATRYTPERAFSGFWYRGPVPQIIKTLKFRGIYPLAALLADLLVEELEERGMSFGEEALLVPIPLSFWRKGKRGYNQAELLARGLGERLSLKVDPSILRKVKDTEPLAQKGITREERLRRVRGVFDVPKDKMGALEDKDILLVDDVLTSGATTREAARVLKKAGARQVWVLTFAKSRLWRGAKR